MISDAELDNWFTYHSPSPAQQQSYVAIREAAKLLARTIRDRTPPSADQTAAIRKIREAVMTANAAIACASSPGETSSVRDLCAERAERVR